MFDPRQVESFRQQAASAGLSGQGLIDVQPGRGIIRIKLDIAPPADQAVFTEQFSRVLGVMLSGMNVSVRTHVSEQDAGDRA